MLAGVDVSNFQGAYGWSDEQFGFCKATEGTFFQDPTFAKNWQAMSAKSIRRGAYHFGHPSSSAANQAAYFTGLVKAHGLNTTDVLALDLEVSDGLPAAQVAGWAVQFCTAVEKSTGKNTWIYTDHSFIEGGYCDGLYKHPLWIADPSQPAGKPTSVAPWPIWVAQQCATKQVGSITVDTDFLNGDTEVWDALANLVQPVSYKTVTGVWVSAGMFSLTKLCQLTFNGTSVDGVQASTVLRLTLDNSPDQVFAPDLAAYISAGDLCNAPVPRGTTLYYPKKVQVS